MKKSFLVLLLAGVCVVFAVYEKNAPRRKFDSAIKFLNSQTKLLYGTLQVEMAKTNDPEKKAQIKAQWRKLWAAAYAPGSDERAILSGNAEHQVEMKWLDAVDIIHQSHRECDVSLLMPFLGMGKDVPLAVSFSDPPPDLKTERTRWPVFATLLDMPNAAQDMEKFSLDRNNPINYRVDAYVVLNCLDKERATKVADLLEMEIKSTTLEDKREMLKYIDYVENFNGTYFRGASDSLSNGVVIGSSTDGASR